MNKLLISSLLFLFILLACSKSNTSNNASSEPKCYKSIFSGNWYSIDGDTLHIDSFQIVGKLKNFPCPIDTAGFSNFYEFCIIEDTIRLQYYGSCRVAVPPHNTIIDLRKDSFRISQNSAYVTWYYNLLNKWYKRVK